MVTNSQKIYIYIRPPPPLLVGKSDLWDSDWLCDFMFAVDIFLLVNELNMKLQGKDQFLHKMYTNVIAFKSELTLFS